MPRTARNVVEFVVGDTTYRAVFKHEHCKEHKRQVCLIGQQVVHKGGFPTNYVPHQQHGEMKDGIYVRTPCVMENAVEEPLLDGTIRLRHITKCDLYVKKGDRIGTGQARCSVKDVYDWHKGIKDAFIQALYDAGFSSNHPKKGMVPDGRFVGAYYAELRNSAKPRVECKCPSCGHTHAEKQ